jgi:hypothetical protein
MTDKMTTTNLKNADTTLIKAEHKQVIRDSEAIPFG